MMMILLASVGWFKELGLFYWLGFGVIGVILIWEHLSLKQMKSYEKINPIFFTANAWISVIYFVFVAWKKFSKTHQLGLWFRMNHQ